MRLRVDESRTVTAASTKSGAHYVYLYPCSVHVVARRDAMMRAQVRAQRQEHRDLAGSCGGPARVDPTPPPGRCIASTPFPPTYSI